MRGITDLERANEFLRSQYIAEFNSKFTVAAAEKGLASVRLRRKDLDWIFSSQNERTVNQDNTIQLGNRVFQLEQTRWRNTLAGQTVVVHEHLDGRVSIRYGPNLIAQYSSDELPPQALKRRGNAKTPNRTKGSLKKCFVLPNHLYANPENRGRLNPAGGLCPALLEPPSFAGRSTYAKRSQIISRTFHLLFNRTS